MSWDEIYRVSQMMKRLLLMIFCCLWTEVLLAQVPYFAGTVGNGHLYGYTSLKVRPNQNAQETYTCFQYGIGDYFAAGTDIYTGAGASYWGALVRAGRVFSPYFGIGAQVTPSFDLKDHFKYSYTIAALYMNGDITKDGKLFWVSNTWWGINKGADNTIANWEYLGYTIQTGKSQSITPIVGCIHSWKFDQDVDISFGAYYSIGKWNLYAWCNDLLKDHPRFVIGVDFKLSTK